MKKLSLIFLGCVICLTVCTAQSFRYDTIPAGQLNSNKSFRYDTIRTNTGTPQKTTEYARQAKPQSTSSFKKENLVIGGNFGMYFGEYTSLNISPQIGYRFNQYFTAGVGLGYTYYKTDYYYGYEDWTQNYLGGNIYLQANPIPFIRLQVQPEVYGFWGSYQPETKAVACILMGAGVNLPVGGNGGISMMVYYDVLQDKYSPYGNQVFYSVGYSFGF